MQGISPLLSEDILCYFALLTYYGSCVNGVLLAFLGGAGLHVTQLEPNQLDRLSRFVFAAQVLYAVCLGLIKLSIARCLQRIFFIRNFRIAAYVVMGFSVVWTLQAILIAVLICQPVYLNWDPTVRKTCGNQTVGFTSVAIVDIVSDLMLIVLPLKPLVALRINTLHKAALLLIFGAGFITIVVSAIRLYITYKIDYSDLPYYSVGNNYLSIIQPGIAIMVACSPLLKAQAHRRPSTRLTVRCPARQFRRNLGSESWYKVKIVG
ncbi:hypothetical protein F4815DRAFT_477634 [Daldinia loculata]|nr:hypothetical protein F4815DRAFT_477634 [Daldinia loculata]